MMEIVVKMYCIVYIGEDDGDSCYIVLFYIGEDDGDSCYIVLYCLLRKYVTNTPRI